MIYEHEGFFWKMPQNRRISHDIYIIPFCAAPAVDSDWSWWRATARSRLPRFFDDAISITSATIAFDTLLASSDITWLYPPDDCARCWRVMPLKTTGRLAPKHIYFKGLLSRRYKIPHSDISGPVDDVNESYIGHYRRWYSSMPYTLSDRAMFSTLMRDGGRSVTTFVLLLEYDWQSPQFRAARHDARSPYLRIRLKEFWVTFDGWREKQPGCRQCRDYSHSISRSRRRVEIIVVWRRFRINCSRCRLRSADCPDEYKVYAAYLEVGTTSFRLRTTTRLPLFYYAQSEVAGGDAALSSRYEVITFGGAAM